MKKPIALLSLLVLSLSANAGFQEHDGKSARKSQGVTNVSQAKKARDNTPVTLTGNIIQCRDDDDCIFRDKTGTIRIDIEDGAWRGQSVTAKQSVRIRGKVDVDDDSGRRSIDVYQIDKR